MKEIYYRYNPWWDKDYRWTGMIDRPAILRLLTRHLASKQIIFLTGLRRVGKTTVLKLLIKRLIQKEKIKAKHIFYVSLDDYLLKNKSILDLVEEYRKIHKIPFQQKLYLFFDEIAFADSFELQLKNFYDNQNVKIFASSSSASILKSKKPYLTGRNFGLELLPLDFQEYLAFKKIKIKNADESLAPRYFKNFLETGGLPEYVLKPDIEYLKELVDDIIRKDIASFYKIKNTGVLEDFFVLLMERAGKIASINKLANILKISPDSAHRYFKMFTDTFLIYPVPRFGKTNETILSPKKIYAADLGIRTLFTGARDIGSLFENYIYFKIKNLNPSYVYQGGNEIDFFTKNKILIEVKYNRDIEGRQQALYNSFNADKKIVVRGFNDLAELEKII